MSNQQNDLAIVLGYQEVTVIRLGEALEVGHATKTETVKVLLVDIEHYPQLLSSLGDELAQIQVYCDRPIEWVKSLSPVSHKLVIETAERINRDFFPSWVQRRLDKLEMIKPGLVASLSEGLLGTTKANGPHLAPSLPKPRATPD